VEVFESVVGLAKGDPFQLLMCTLNNTALSALVADYVNELVYLRHHANEILLCCLQAEFWSTLHRLVTSTETSPSSAALGFFAFCCDVFPTQARGWMQPHPCV
jgi:hypothetical protein